MMKVKVTSTIRDPTEIGIEKRKAFIARKAKEWDRSVGDILRSDSDARHMIDDVRTESTKTGFIGVIDNPAAKQFEFGVEEDIVSQTGGVDIAATPELAPMRRALSKL